MGKAEKQIQAECPACGARSFLASGESLDPSDAFLQNRMTEAGAPDSTPRPAEKKRTRATKKRTPPRSRRRRA